MNELQTNTDYKNWLIELKTNIKRSQIKAALAVNSQLIQLYWDLGKQIVEKQANTTWGSGFIDQLSKDLKAEFPEMGGFSLANVKYCKQFYLFYINTPSTWEQVVPTLENEIHQQLVSELKNTENQLVIKSEQVVRFLKTKLFNIPWGHHVLILKKIKDPKKPFFTSAKPLKTIGVGQCWNTKLK